MKNTTKILILILITAVYSNLQAQCVQCDENNSNLGSYSSVIGMSNTTTTSSTAAFAGGYGSIADGDFAFAYGGYATAQGNNTLAIGRYVTAGVDNAMVIGRGSSTTHRLVNNEPNSLVIGFNSDIPTLFVKSNGTNTVGKVGIGTTTPTTLLDINGTLNVEDAVSLRDNLTVIGEFSLNGAATFGDNLSIAGELDVTDNTTFGNNLSVNNKLTTHQLQLTTEAGANKILTSDANGNALWTPVEDVIPESIWTEDNENVYVQYANVGIGTDSPLGKLHIDMGTNKPGIICTSTTNIHSDATDIKFITDANNGNTIFSTFTSNWAPSYNWQCGTNGKGTYTAMTLELKSWGTKLRLHGNLLCEQVEVMENVPNSDFVFEEDYSLMSLQELETYVNEYHHLPEIPSAAEFKENGYNMNDMDDLLLRKVEELTLYIINADQEREEMRSLIKQLQKENNILKERGGDRK